jgi:hypothetical protein
MPDYAAQWDSVWNPYRTYAAHNNDRGAVTIIGHVNEIKEKRLGKEESLPESLRELNKVFLTELENYRAKCRLLKNPNTYTQNLAYEVQNLNTTLRQSGSMAFMPESGVALRLCANVAKVIAQDKGLIQGNAHTGLVHNIVYEIGKISVGLAGDRSLYGSNVVAETLRKIRENP